MRDLQHRLAALGHVCEGDDPGAFGPATTAATTRFQEKRGLPTTGVCDLATWEALVEAGWKLGDRPLYLTTPMLRGDDVADLQRRLGAIGFDAGRVDGIFGPRTDRALTEFQRNAGLVADAICGPATVGGLARLGDRERADAYIADVRERERFRCGPQSLAGRTIVIAHGGGLDALTSAIVRLLRADGANAVLVQHPDGSAQASHANDLEADVFLTFAMADGVDEASGCRIAYYRSPAGPESPGGRLLAELLHEELLPLLPCETRGVAPMSIPILRETRMPAVAVDLAPPAVVVERTGQLAAAVPPVLHRWVTRFGAER